MGDITDISKHPKFKSSVPPEIGIGDGVNIPIPDMGYSDPIPNDEVVDQALMEMIQGARKEVEEERNLIGNNVCWLCTYRKDPRPWWKRFLARPNETTYQCTATSRTEVADPVSGLTRYVHRIKNLIGEDQAVLVDQPHQNCVELNQDGQCPSFNIRLVE